jgi:hypothetical protein
MADTDVWRKPSRYNCVRGLLQIHATTLFCVFKSVLARSSRWHGVCGMLSRGA